MTNEFEDLTLDDVKIGGETIRDQIIHDDPVVEEEDVKPEPTEAPVAQKEEVKEEVKEEAPVDVFPSDRLGGKYKSWEEVQTALEQPKETDFKDDFIKKVVEKYNQDGSLEDFFKAYSTDWDKMSDQDVLKEKFFEDNADMEDDKAVERLWKKELSKYTIDADEYDQEEIETGLALMKRDAKKVRTALKEQQAQFIEPQSKKDGPDEGKRIEALKKFVDEDPIVQAIKQTKIVSLDIDGEKYNFELDNPEIIAESLVNENLFYNQFVTNGKPDTGKWAEVMAYVTNPQKFRKSLVDYGRSLERKSMEGELKNTSLPRQEASKSGSTGDEREDLLNAFVAKGKLVKR